LDLLKKRKYYDEEEDKKMKEGYYKGIVIDKATYQELHQLSFNSFKKAKRRENIFSIVDRHPDYTLRCLYTNRILETPEGKVLEPNDEEHSVPQSYQAGTGKGCGKDMHQIFACSKNANGSRGNIPFGFSELISDAKDFEEKDGGVFYKGKKKSFIPKFNIGAVCRSTLYIMTTYDKAMNEEKFPKEFLPWIKEKAFEEEVTLWEKHRNYELHKLQLNRNPFVDFPGLAKIVDFSNGYQDLKTESK